MKRRINPVVVVCMLIAAVTLIGIVTTLIMRRIPTRKQMDLTEYYGQTDDSEAVIIVGTQILEQKAVMSGEQPYLPVDVVDSYLNQRYYWDEEGQQILYATPSELIYTPASAEAGGDVWLKDGTAYLSLDFIKRYTDLDTYVYQQPNRIAIQKDFSGVSVVTATKDTYVRYRGGIKSEVLSRVNKGDNLILMEELENWDQVATWDGYIGYIEKSSVSDIQNLNMDREAVGESYTYLTMDQPVNLVWHQVMSTDANAGLSEAIQNMTGVNVISPTWFYVTDNNGNIINNATADYVSLAHEKGLKVWGLVDDFKKGIKLSQVLGSTTSRTKLINGLVGKAIQYDLDGINIDFEHVTKDNAAAYLEFLRELTIKAHINELVISVDNYTPAAHNAFYNIKEQGKVVDYVILMAYDEHYQGSEESGSVSSLEFVKNGVASMVASVPKERVVAALPFYTRLWKESKSKGGKPTSQAYGMSAAETILKSHDTTAKWDDTTGQYFAQYKDGGYTYKIWLEEETSLGKKMDEVAKQKVAGFAFWKLGCERPATWSTIQKYCK